MHRKIRSEKREKHVFVYFGLKMPCKSIRRRCIYIHLIEILWLVWVWVYLRRLCCVYSLNCERLCMFVNPFFNFYNRIKVEWIHSHSFFPLNWQYSIYFVRYARVSCRIENRKRKYKMLYLQNQAERIEEQTHFIRTHKHLIRTYFKINKRGSIGK